MLAITYEVRAGLVEELVGVVETAEGKGSCGFRAIVEAVDDAETAVFRRHLPNEFLDHIDVDAEVLCRIPSGEHHRRAVIRRPSRLGCGYPVPLSLATREDPPATRQRQIDDRRRLTTNFFVKDAVLGGLPAWEQQPCSWYPCLTSIASAGPGTAATNDN